MKFREKYSVKIDLYDAFVGGLFLYFSTYLISLAFGFLLVFISVVASPTLMAQFFPGLALGGSYLLNEATIPFVLALSMTVALFTFLLVVLFEEHYFSKHEKSTKDLIGLGLVWGTVFIAVEAIMNSGFAAMSQGGFSIFLPNGIRAFTTDYFFWPMVVYIVFLPWLFQYSKTVKARGK